MKGLACLLLTLAVGAEPGSVPTPLSGVYRVGSAGLFELVTRDGAVVGTFRSGGECGYQANLPVITGHLEGSVLVGSMLLCQEGPGCPAQRTVPFLALRRGEQLMGLVKLERGCASPALADRRLLFRPATPEELGARTAEAPPASPEERTRRGVAATQEGQEHLGAGRFQQAREAFDVALRYDQGNYVALLGLGTAQVKLQEYEGALGNLRRTLELARRAGAPPTVTAQAQYDLACVHAQQHRKAEALKALSVAAQLTGPELLEDLEHDPDLEPLRKEPEFRRQVAALRARGARPPRPTP